MQSEVNYFYVTFLRLKQNVFCCHFNGIDHIQWWNTAMFDVLSLERFILKTE